MTDWGWGPLIVIPMTTHDNLSRNLNISWLVSHGKEQSVVPTGEVRKGDNGISTYAQKPVNLAQNGIEVRKIIEHSEGSNQVKRLIREGQGSHGYIPLRYLYSLCLRFGNNGGINVEPKHLFAIQFLGNRCSYSPESTADIEQLPTFAGGENAKRLFQLWKHMASAATLSISWGKHLQSLPFGAGERT